MIIGEVCNREVVVMERDGAVLEAANLMRSCHVGTVIVVEQRANLRVPVGILTDRDIVVELLAEDVRLSEVSVGDVMSHDLLVAAESDPLLETVKLMKQRGVRRIPVVNDEGGLEGILSVDDLVELIAEQLADVVALIGREQRREGRVRQ